MVYKHICQQKRHNTHHFLFLTQKFSKEESKKETVGEERGTAEGGGFRRGGQ